MATVTEGQTVAIYEQFLDDDGEALYPAESKGAPSVRVYDAEKAVIAEVIASVDPTELGQWRADIPIPFMDLEDVAILTARWIFVADDGERYTSRTKIEVQPANPTNDEDIIVLVGRDAKMELTLPFKFTPPVEPTKADVINQTPARPGRAGDELSFSLYFNNNPIYENLDWKNGAVKLNVMHNKTQAVIPAVVGQPRMAPLTLLVSHKKPRQMTPTIHTFKVWAVTPSILMAASHVEDFINKAKMDNVIPELEYRQSDLLECLYRGLQYFNGLQPIITDFTGTNMQGPILSAWLTCSTYFALGAQVQAEGALAFDFGGQTVSLNIDRTPAIESALGRIDAEIENQVKPLKKLLGRAGVINGDGSQGGRFIDGSRSLGTLGLTNAPTTRIPWAGRGGWFRNF